MAIVFLTSRRTTRIGGEEPGQHRLLNAMRDADDEHMGHAERIHTYDDELHERRRRLAIVRTPIDFEAERLKRLVEKSRDTANP